MANPEHGPLTMTKEEIAVGLRCGRGLTQEEWAHPDEIRFVDELIAEGIAAASPFEYKDEFQCERRLIWGAEPSTTGMG